MKPSLNPFFPAATKSSNKKLSVHQWQPNPFSRPPKPHSCSSAIPFWLQPLPKPLLLQILPSFSPFNLRSLPLRSRSLNPRLYPGSYTKNRLRLKDLGLMV
ncbi:hypothetical protein GBA52_013852 [Prunus armeniaca]|nr:hypothetical protein GBA52_013852 [Prunus armeniaca]